MPEYLAPGVYVEETSFRAKSIEGVSTSTTGLVGPTRKGPTSGTPELITNLGDFERIYGGLEDLSFESAATATVNYLAHAVRAYFAEGGSRLYVSRVYLAAGTGDDVGHAAHTPAWIVSDGSVAATSARFVTRFAGRGGDGQLELIEKASDATKKTLDAAPTGSLARFGGQSPPLSARVEGSLALPLSLSDGDQLLLTVDAVNQDLTVRGQAAELTADAALVDPVTIDGTNDSLEVTIDGGTPQALTLPQNDYTPAEVVAMVNQALRGGFARLTGSDELVIGSDRRGSGASVVLGATHTALGFTATLSATNTADANNNVADLAAVSAAEIDALLSAGAAAGASLAGNLELSTAGTGATASLEVRTGTAAGFGLAVGSVTGTDGAAITYYRKTAGGWRDPSDNPPPGFDALADTAAPAGGAQLLTLNVVAEDADGQLQLFEDLGFDAAHPRYVGNVLAAAPSRSLDRLENLYAAVIGAGVTPFALRGGLFPGDARSRTLTFSQGSDGLEPTQAAYEAALEQLEKLENISIVAAPGSSALSGADGIRGALVAHAERRRAYRVAVLDSRPDDVTTGSVRSDRGKFDSTYAAFYYPWVVVSNPLARPGDESRPRELTLPPSGFLCGIYARSDVNRGVYKAPANEVVRGALRFSTDVNFAEQEVLNPIGINCLRFFDGRGFRVWGARTLSSDPEWKYVNVRRYFIFLEQSIDRSTQWAVFEPNGPRLWANIRETISGFLYNEWRSGALLGTTPEEAYFVRCDRSTMTQNDLDNGRLICEIGVAVLKPAEFVIFRIGQKTADARS